MFQAGGNSAILLLILGIYEVQLSTAQGQTEKEIGFIKIVNLPNGESRYTLEIIIRNLALPGLENRLLTRVKNTQLFRPRDRDQLLLLFISLVNSNL